jgi:hypothetical protein
MNRYAQRVRELRGEYLFSPQPAVHLSAAQIEAFERELGQELPSDYREFLTDYGGYGFFAGAAYPSRRDEIYWMRVV